MQDAGGELLLIVILRTSPFGDSRKFALKEFCEVRIDVPSARKLA
jgi:hypothetical protein